MTKIFEDSEFLMHDINNILFSISGMIMNGYITKAELKMKKIFGNIPKNTEKISTIHYLIYSKLKIMDKMNIVHKLNRNMIIPKTDESKLCIIFGNILDNAIESCCFNNSCKRIIKVKFINNKYKYKYIISNYVNVNKTKKSKHKHLGLKIVRKIAKKEKIKFHVSKKNKEFKVRLEFKK